MSDMDALNAQIEAGVAKQQHKEVAMRILTDAVDENLGVGTATAGEIVIYTGLYDNDTDVRELLADTDILSPKEDS